jgi:hypothetical protein
VTLILLLGALAAGPAPEPVPPKDLDARVIRLLSEAGRVRPGGPKALRLARELDLAADEYLERGEAGRSVELAARALALDPEDTPALLRIALGNLHLQNFEAARAAVEAAQLRAAEAPARLFRNVGMLFDEAGFPADAAGALETAVRLGVRDLATLAALARARREMPFSGSQRILELPGFRILFDADLPADVVERTGEILESERRRLDSTLGLGAAGRQTVVLYAARAYFSLAAAPDWAGALYDGAIRLCLETDHERESDLAEILTHELVHALLSRATERRAPPWLQEGLAQWMSGRRLPCGGFVPSGQIPDAGALQTLLLRPGAAETAKEAYAAALGMVQELADRRGEGTLACLVRALVSGLRAETALLLETGLTADELLDSSRSDCPSTRPGQQLGGAGGMAGS